MEIEVVDARPEAVEADVVVFAVTDPVELGPAARAIDEAVGGKLTHLVADGELTGERGAVTLLHTRGELPAHRVAAAGLGRQDALDADALRTAAGRAGQRAVAVGGRALAWVVEDGELAPPTQGRAVVDGLVLGPFDTGEWKTTGERPAGLERLILCGPGAAGAAAEARRAAVAASWANRCRSLVNTPANELTPAGLAAFAEEVAAGSPHLRPEALDADGIRGLGMNALAAVAQGSVNPPRLVVLTYEPPDAPDEPVLGLVGKAITFDSGGLSLKPAGRMSDMKTDMGGGGAVLAGLGAVAELALPLRIVAVVGACENMPDGGAYRPGDVIRAANGKTIEVTNTDAEGRLVLADCLWYARERGATHVLDIATLTGGVVTALGDFYAGLFGNDAGWVEEVRTAAEASGDHAWPLPLHETYARLIRSAYADMTNSADVKQATPIYAARFLQEFAGDGPWAHLDVAGTAHIERSRDDYFTSEGATGFGVRLLAELARRLAQ
jgi:leucyl aminopeptidase